MENLTKRDLVVRISNETNLVQQDVLKVIQFTLDHIKESLLKGDAVQLRNFGVFEIKIRKARVGRNPNKPKSSRLVGQITYPFTRFKITASIYELSQPPPRLTGQWHSPAELASATLPAPHRRALALLADSRNL